MIVWVNGTFGAGKTTTATLLVDRLADGRLFDAEEVGYLSFALWERSRISELLAVGAPPRSTDRWGAGCRACLLPRLPLPSLLVTP
jgi:hypothetical protein